MSRPSWHRQAGLEAAVNAVRPDLDHEVRVDLMRGIALAVPAGRSVFKLSVSGRLPALSEGPGACYEELCQYDL